MTCVMFLAAGSCLPPQTVAVEQGVLFCDAEEPRRFTQREVDWRSANAPENLRRDFRTNLTWDQECEPEV
jgi:hypothetical protein